jgi:hypothetical protein
MAVAELLISAIGVVLTVAGLLKLWQPDRPAQFLADLGLPKPFTPTAVRIAAGMEVCLGLFASSLAASLIAALLTSALFFLFTGIIALGAVRGAASCGCFGPIESVSTRSLELVRTASILTASLGAALLVYLEHCWQPPSAPQFATSSQLGGGAVGCALIAGFGWISRVTVLMKRYRTGGLVA